MEKVFRNNFRYSMVFGKLPYSYCNKHKAYNYYKQIRFVRALPGAASLLPVTVSVGSLHVTYQTIAVLAT